MKRIATFLISIILSLSTVVTAVASDDFTGLQWYLNGHVSSEGDISYGINLSKFSLAFKDDSVPVVAVIDTGVDYNQEDLASQMWVNPYPDQLEGTYGYDFGDHDSDPYDNDGHGTHVAGIIAAAENEYGIDGICDARIMALKVQPTGSEGLDADAIVESFDYIYRAMQLGVNVKAVNCSWGHTTGYSSKFQRNYCDIFKDYIDKIGKLGALTVFAAGNDVDNGDLANYGPYDINSKYMVTVGATDERDRPAWFTSYGQEKVDLFAPGINILSCSPVYKSVVWDHFKYVCRFDEAAFDQHPNDNYQGYVASEYEIYTPQEIGLYSRFDCSTAVRTENGNNYLEFTVSRGDPANHEGLVNPVDERLGFLYIDVTDMNFDPSYEYEIRIDLASANGDLIYWNRQQVLPETYHDQYDDLRFINIDGRKYMRFCGLDDATLGNWVNSDGKSRVLIDNILIFRREYMTTNKVKYEIKEGTSMAAPIVSGAVALISRANPSASAIQLREALMDSTRKLPSLKKYCVSGGILDLSKVKMPGRPYKILVPKYSKLTKSYKQYKNKKIKIATKKSGTGSLSPRISWKTTNARYATVNQSGEVTLKKASIGHKVGVVVTCYNGSKNISNKCIINVKK